MWKDQTFEIFMSFTSKSIWDKESSLSESMYLCTELYKLVDHNLIVHMQCFENNDM